MGRIIIKRRRAQRVQTKPELTAEEKREAKRIYQHEYYHAHREELCEYQKEWNRKNKNRLATRQRYNLKHSATRKDYERAEIIDVYNPSSLMNLQPEKLEKAVNRILGGVCDYVGAR